MQTFKRKPNLQRDRLHQLSVHMAIGSYGSNYSEHSEDAAIVKSALRETLTDTIKTKAAVGAVGMSSGLGASEQVLGEGIMAYEGQAGVWPTAFPFMKPGVINKTYGIVVGAQTFGASAEGNGRPVAAFDVTAKTLEPVEVAAIIVKSMELWSGSREDPATTDLLLNRLNVSRDLAFVGTELAAASAVAAAGLDAVGIARDCRYALAMLSVGAGEPVLFCWGLDIAKRMVAVRTSTGAAAFPNLTLTGGPFLGGIACVSEALGNDVLVLAPGGYAAASGEARLDRAKEGSIEMDTGPSMSSITPTETTLINLFQSKSIAIRVQHEIAWERLRAGTAVKITGANALWGREGSPPL